MNANDRLSFKAAYAAGLGHTNLSHGGFAGFSGFNIEREVYESASEEKDEENKKKQLAENMERWKETGASHRTADGSDEEKAGYNYDKNNGGFWQPLDDQGGDTSGGDPTY